MNIYDSYVDIIKSILKYEKNQKICYTYSKYFKHYFFDEYYNNINFKRYNLNQE